MNSNQVQTFSYVAMNRLTSAATNVTGQGKYTQKTYAYKSTTGNLSSKSDVGVYTYAPSHPHAVTQAGSNTYAYDQNGNMTIRTVGGVVWTYSYNAENQLIEIKKDSQVVSEYGYDGDGKRVWAKDYKGYLATQPKVTTYVGNHYEVRVEGYVQPASGGSGQPCSAPSYCSYFPLVANSYIENISYYYADGQRIAMNKNGGVSYLYGDQLGSVSAVANASGALVSRSLYHPWGTSRYAESTSPTDYGFTGQMQEGDIYFYNARWYDPTIGRFMQADTIVPTTQGIQGFDRYAYVINNPLKYADPSGHCNDGVSTAFCVVAGAMVIGAIGGYVAQVAQNMSAGLSFGDALVTDISATPILQGAAIAGLGVTAAITGGAALGVGASTIVTVGQGACADGDCTNEGALALEGLKKTGEFFSDKIGSTGSIGQKTLELISGTSQKFFPTPYGGRFIDRLSDLGTAMEAKVGYQALTYTIKTQIMKDAFLVQNHPAIQVVEWHFFRSPVTGKIGPSGPLRDFLIENGFKAIIH